jgi:hypothetical protein
MVRRIGAKAKHLYHGFMSELRRLIALNFNTEAVMTAGTAKITMD